MQTQEKESQQSLLLFEDGDSVAWLTLNYEMEDVEQNDSVMHIKYCAHSISKSELSSLLCCMCICHHTPYNTFLSFTQATRLWYISHSPFTLNRQQQQKQKSLTSSNKGSA